MENKLPEVHFFWLV